MGDGAAEDAEGNTSLRAAVMEANALGGKAEITLAAGEYKLTRSGAGEDAASTGDLDVTGDITIVGAGVGTAVGVGVGVGIGTAVGASVGVGVTVGSGVIPGTGVGAGAGVGVGAAVAVRGRGVGWTTTDAWSTVAVGIATLLILSAGNALNDACDQHIDRVNRPRRPIPSGRVTARGAVRFAAMLMVAGVALAGSVNLMAVAVAMGATVCGWFGCSRQRSSR